MLTGISRLLAGAPPALRQATRVATQPQAIQVRWHSHLVRPNHIDPNCDYNRYLLGAKTSSSKNGHGRAVITFNHAAHRTDLLNSAKSVHGGAIAGLHDVAACQALSAMGLEGATKSMTISYFAPSEAVDLKELRSEAKVVDIRGNTAHIHSNVYKNDKLVGQATLIFSVWWKKTEDPVRV